MVDGDIVQRKIQFIEQSLLKLETLRKNTSEQFFESFQNIDSAKHNLQVAIEAIIDIANHIVARERFGVPDSSAEAVGLLRTHGILNDELTKRICLMVKFRNRIVHLYHEVDDWEVYRILQEDLPDIGAFIKAIVAKL